jgi:hypothetical protein
MGFPSPGGTYALTVDRGAAILRMHSLDWQGTKIGLSTLIIFHPTLICLFACQTKL